MTTGWPTCERKTCGRPQRVPPFAGRGYQVPICEALQGSGSGRCSRTRWNPEGEKPT